MHDTYRMYDPELRYERSPECCQQIVRTLHVAELPGGVVHFTCQLPVGHDGEHRFDDGA